VKIIRSELLAVQTSNVEAAQATAALPKAALEAFMKLKK
jgi:hypothetical protein